MTFDSVEEKNDERILFKNKKLIYILEHQQSCSEEVYIESIVGDLNDLVGSPILVAECTYRYSDASNKSEIWTFIKFATNKGWVDIRFFGTSNGYYSETPELYRVFYSNEYNSLPIEERRKIKHYKIWMV